MRVLVLGKNGREHALVWKIAQSPLVTELFCAPGNPGTASLAQNIECDINNPEAVVALTKRLNIDLLVIGPEDPLAAGVADAVRREDTGCAVFGPNANAARLEWSKEYSKGFMKRYAIPTASYKTFLDRNQAKAYLTSCPLPIVIKTDGLAAGKGVIIARSREQALESTEQLPAGQSLVVEEYLTGREVSVFAVTDGTRFHIWDAAEDHKQLYDGDIGPNTGGMGAYAPVDFLAPELLTAVRGILESTLRGLRAEGAEYRGVIYLGLMITNRGIKVLEYNSRFGDPECQVLMMRLEEDVVPYLYGAAVGQLPSSPPQWGNEAVALIVACGEEYPAKASRGHIISGVDRAQGVGCTVFHAGTTMDNGHLITNGGRILNVAGKAPSLAQALSLAYQGIVNVDFAGMHYRRDIGMRKVKI